MNDGRGKRFIPTKSHPWKRGVDAEKRYQAIKDRMFAGEFVSPQDFLVVKAHNWSKNTKQYLQATITYKPDVLAFNESH